jgi:hypothetical protein
VVDIDPPSVRLTFSGGVTGTTAPDENGNFSYTTTDAALGMVHVHGVNSLDMTARNQDPLTVDQPAITVGVAYGSRNTVTLSGSVTDIDADQLIVSLRGVARGVAATDETGEFSVTTTADGVGTVNVTTVNLWGLRERVSVTVYSAPPQIINFEAVKAPGGIWTFSGFVEDEDPAGLVVYFSNLPGLEGKSAVVGSDGRFCLTLRVDISQPGQLHADVIDWFKLAADTAWTDIFP